MATDAWGIDDGYEDTSGTWHPTPDATRRALRVAMGGLADVADPPPQTRPVWFVRQGSGPGIQRPAELVLEDGTVHQARDALPLDLPPGYHDLHPDDGGPTTRLIVTPDRCHLRAGWRAWGWSAQLYGARSEASWGIGDLVDLRRLLSWSAGLGAGVVAVNPLHAPLPLDRQEPSPYNPSSRRFRSPLYLRLEDVRGFDVNEPALAAASAAGRALNAERRIDRDAVWRVKLAALEHLWAHGTDGTDLADSAYARAEGDELVAYATFCALAQHHGSGWRSWPAEHRRPDSPAVVRFASANADRVRFHRWVQCLLDDQLSRAAATGTADGAVLLGDLAVGVDPDGADAWCQQEQLAHGVRVGAPPDTFNAEGQDWGLPPFVPWKLRAVGYEPFARTVRAALRHLGALRIDHVMGLFRLFWLPDGADPADGAYVRYPATDLLDIVALESARAGVTIVGEDLGTVEDEVRAELHHRGLLSYRVAWFEPDPPARWPEQALATLTTHDLPTVAGLWEGTDGEPVMGERLKALSGDADNALDASIAAHRRLSAAPSMLAVGTLEDALAVPERPNVPGPTTTHPNWSLALPVTIERLEHDPGVAAVAAALGAERPSRK
ncbi:MAG: 4-alpha-glucanotransferase [Acidimicrobiales bacterium]